MILFTEKNSLIMMNSSEGYKFYEEEGVFEIDSEKKHIINEFESQLGDLTDEKVDYIMRTLKIIYNTNLVLVDLSGNLVIDDNYSKKLKEGIQGAISKLEMNKMYDLEISGRGTYEKYGETYSDGTIEQEIFHFNKDKQIKDIKNKFKVFGGNEVFINTTDARFYQPKRSDKGLKENELQLAYMSQKGEIENMRKLGIIKSYAGTRFFVEDGDNEFYPKYDRLSIVKPNPIEGMNYECPKNIELLINNLSNYDKDNFDYINKSILWKLTNLGSGNIPALILYGVGGSGKGLLLNLIGKVFGKTNVRPNIQKSNLTSTFGFDGEAFVAEFAEITQNNTKEDKDIGDILKNIIGSDEFGVRKLYQPVQYVKNITWFIITSNSLKPLQLDVGTGNRRYSTINVKRSLLSSEASDIVAELNNEKAIIQYVNWLYKTYFLDLQRIILPLINQDKKDLEERSKSEQDSFWEWLELTTGPGKFSVQFIKEKHDAFCLENGLNITEERKYLWARSPYVRKSIRDGENTYRGIEIIK